MTNNEPPPPEFESGRIKLELCRRLADSWSDLATLLAIPAADRARFERGDVPRAIWDWLENRDRLGALAAALKTIGRDDLAGLLPDDLALFSDQAIQFAAEKNYRERCREQWSQPRYALDQRFVRLTLLLDQGEDNPNQRWQQSSVQFQDLQEVWSHIDEPVAVVLGSPGAGKSTLLRHYELECAETALAGGYQDNTELTFFIPLNQYRPERPGEPLPLPKDWLAGQWNIIDPDLPALDELLRQGRITLLLDAINEMPVNREEAIALWRDFIQMLPRAWPGSRVVFSCRSLDYSATLSSTAFPVPQLRIEELTDGQVEEFIGKYCKDHCEQLWQNLKDTPQLDLLRVPYYLKMLVDQTQDGEIPEGRAVLFTGFVRQALRREVMAENKAVLSDGFLTTREIQRLQQTVIWKTPFELPERGELIPALSQLAFQMQQCGAAGYRD